MPRVVSGGEGIAKPSPSMVKPNCTHPLAACTADHIIAMLQGGVFNPAGLGFQNVKCTLFTYRNVLAAVRREDVQKAVKSTLRMIEAEALVKLLSVLGFKFAQFPVATDIIKVLMTKMGRFGDNFKTSSSESLLKKRCCVCKGLPGNTMLHHPSVVQGPCPSSDEARVLVVARLRSEADDLIGRDGDDVHIDNREHSRSEMRIPFSPP